MKNLYIAVLLAVLPSYGSLVSQSLIVNPGPVGTLNQAIANNPTINTFILKRNFPYLISGELVLDREITLLAEAGPGKRPIILYGPPPGAPTVEQLIRTNKNITLKGLHVTNRDNLGGISQRMIRVIADDVRVTLEDCLFEDSGQAVVRMDAKGGKIYSKDCIGARLGQPTFPSDGRYFDDRGNQVDSLVFENCLVYNVTSRIIRDGGAEIDYLRIQNCTFGQVLQRGLEIGQVKEFVFLNNIFFDMQLSGRDSSLVPANNEGSDEASWIRIDSVPTGGENWTIGYSNFFYSQPNLDYYDFPFVEESGDTIVPTAFYDPEVAGAIQAGGWQSTIITEQIDFKNQPVFAAAILDTLHYGLDANSPTWNMSGITPDPVYSQLPVGTNRFVTMHDFNYACDKISNSAGLNGARLGAQLTGTCFVPVRDLFDAHGVIFYPNPAQDFLFVQGLEQIVRVQWFALDGRLMGTVQPNAEYATIPLAGANSGVYCLSLTDARGRVSTRIFYKDKF
jgi:hypothetical protein